jgi:hypothetical protein
MSKQGLSAACVALTFAFAAGCGGDSQDVDPSRSLAAGVQRAQAVQQAAAPTAATGPNRPPVIASLSFSPAQPVSEGQFEARVAASDPDGNLVQFNFRWLVNGRTLQEGARPTVQLPKLERGDSVEVVVRANDGTLESEEKRLSARFENRPPEITFLYVTPQNKKIRRGDVLTAVPEASDPENDHLEFSYSWRVNGTELGHERQFDTKSLHRGDKIVLQVVANDGFRESYPRALDPIVLVNSAPEIKQLPTLQRQGAQLRYQFEAEDAEGDKNLRFFLQDAPEGMEIDAFSGLLTWEPTPEQAGKHLVKVCVKDSEGDASAFPWEVNVTAEAAPASSASE